MIVWQIQSIQNRFLCHPLFAFNRNLILMTLLHHHFKTLLVIICHQTQQVFFEVKCNVGLNFARLKLKKHQKKAKNRKTVS